MCVFAKWNVEGILAGFSPSEAYRRAHVKDAGESPLIQQIQKAPTPLEKGFPANQALPKVAPNPLFPVPSYNSIRSSLEKIMALRRR